MNGSMLLAPCLLLGTAMSLPAQWAEAGDAGPLPRTAQIPVGVGPLSTIAGVLAADDVDMFQIQIVDRAVFSASTVGGTAVDTRLFLFDEQGRGVVFDDDTASPQSTITGAFVPAPGRYWLAVSAQGLEARANGLAIWNSAPIAMERPADGPGRGGSVDGWAGTAVGGAYTIALAGAAFPGRQLLLPDNHHLGESATQAQANGTASWWGPATVVGRRFLVLYEGSHFTGVGGVSGPIGITHLRFRGEDTEHNVGGQRYTGVTVNVFKTTLTMASYNPTTFAANLAPAAPHATTLLGSASFPTLWVARSLGTAPNNAILDVDFGAPLAPFDPLADPNGQRNLLVEVSYAGAAAAADPQGSSMIAIQDTTGSPASLRGRGTYAASPTATVGTPSAAPPVIGVEFDAGAGGFATLVPATNERYGAACGGAPASFYQLFAHDECFDLADPGQADGLSGLRLTPDVYPSPNYYTVSGGASPVDLVAGLGIVPTTQGDDDTMVHALPPGITFDYPGGSTGTIRASCNGYVILDPASTEGSISPGNFASDYSPTVAEFLGAGPNHLARLAPFWHDLSPNKNALMPFGDPLTGLHVVDHAAGNEVLVTWYRVGRFNSVPQVLQEAHTMQCSLNWATGVVEFRYGSMDRICGDTFLGTVNGIVGFSRGRVGGVPAVDPQSRDLSMERPFTTSPEGASGNMGLTAVASPVPCGALYLGRAFGGQSLTWNVAGVPAGAVIGVQLLDLAASRPGFTAPGLTAPGCILSTSTGATLWEVTLFPPATVTGTRPLFIPPGFAGTALHAQYVVLDGLSGGATLVTAASNAVKHTVGLQ